jgi:hypothetical protein
VDALDVRTLLQTPTVAHEVGHFLFGSREHAPTGLMRASHRLDYLMQSGYPMFESWPAALASIRCDDQSFAERPN